MVIAIKKQFFFVSLIVLFLAQFRNVLIYYLVVVIHYFVVMYRAI